MESMKRVLAAAVVASGIMVGYAQPESNTPAVGDDKPVMEVNGKTYTSADITSFSQQLENTEGARFASQQELLDEFLLTRFADKIPTTATIKIPETGDKGPSAYPYVEQRQLIKREFQKSLVKSVEVPREEMEAWYKENKSKYEKPERVHALHLFMETSEDAATSSPEKVRARLLELKKEADNGTSFSQLAEKYSEAASAKSGGEIGSITRRMPIGPLSKPMNIELEEAFFKLPVRKVSDVVETRHGMHLLYLTDRETTQIPTVDDLITSGILPEALSQERLTDMVKGLVAKAVKDHNGQFPESGDDVTTDGVAFSLDGKNTTYGDLKAVFGPRFTRFLESVKGDSQALQDLRKQAMDDEAYLLAALDKGIDKLPELKPLLAEIVERKKALQRVQAISEAESGVDEGDVLARYNQMKGEMLRPEAEGSLIQVATPQTSGSAEEARARETTQKLAEDIRAKLESQPLDAVIKSLNAEEATLTTVTQVKRHIIGQSDDSNVSIFDQGVVALGGDVKVGQVRPIGSAFAFVVLDKKYPGEPIPFEQVREGLSEMIQIEKRRAMRNDLVHRLEQALGIKYLPGAAAYGKGPEATGDGAKDGHSH